MDYIIYLQPGGFCHNIQTCHRRCRVAPFLCTSPQADTLEETHGILSSDKRVNRHFSDFRKLVVPYCSGDMFIGARRASNATAGYNFMGRDIITAAVAHMISSAARTVVLAGSSAGGAGVVFNCDYVARLLPRADVRCVVDGAFFYPQLAPFTTRTDCESVASVLRQGATLWNAPQLRSFRPQSAATASSAAWWTTIKQPLFIVTAAVDQFGFESNCGSRQNVDDVSAWASGTQAMALSLALNESAAKAAIGLFMPACYDHMLLTDDVMYSRVKVGQQGWTLDEALGAWMSADAAADATAVQVWDQCDVSNALCNQHCANRVISYEDMHLHV